MIHDIFPGDHIALERYSSLGSGTLGCPVFYVENGRREVMALTNFHVLATPLGFDGVTGRTNLAGMPVAWESRSSGSGGGFQRIGEVFAYDVPFINPVDSHPGGTTDDKVDIALIKLDPNVRVNPQIQPLELIDDTFTRFGPALVVFALEAPFEPFFADFDPLDFTGPPEILGSSETWKFLKSKLQKAEVPAIPYDLGDPLKNKGRLVAKMSASSGYSIGYIYGTDQQFRGGQIPNANNVEYEFYHMSLAKTVLGKGQLEGDSGAAVYDLISGDLYGVLSFQGMYQQVHQWAFSDAQTIKKRFNRTVLRKFGHQGMIRFS